MTGRQVPIQQVLEDRLCLGCGLCAAVNGELRMELSSSGFPEPVADDPELLKRIPVETICPAITLKQTERKSGIETLFGPLREPVQIGHACDEDVRRKASSGGVITAVLLYLLESGLIDGVLQVGKDLRDPSRNAVHLSTTREEVIGNCGSRYAPSSLLAELPAALSGKQRLAVVGKPCDIAGVRNYLEQHPGHSGKVAVTISFMCMGLPSQHATEKLLTQLNPGREEVADFWYRGNGWPGELTVCTAAGRYTLPYETAWQTLGRSTPFRCKICPDGFGEFADFSSGDAWFCRDGGPSFNGESDGRSFVFIRSAVGQQYVSAAAAHGYLKLDSYDLREIRIIQKYQVLRKIYAGVRYLLLKKLRCGYLDFRGMCFLRNLRFATARITFGEIRGFMTRFREHYL